MDGYDDSLEDINYSVLDRLSADDLLACVAQLPPGYRTVFNLYAIEGYTHSEIAEMLHVQEATSVPSYPGEERFAKECTIFNKA